MPNPSYVQLKETASADVPTPSADKDNIFIDPTSGLGYKDDAGATHFATSGGITSLTGDVTASGPGAAAATIANNAVTNAKAAQMAAHTFKGNNTGGASNPIDLTVTQATAELNAFVGDSGSGGTKGLVPAPSAGDSAAGKFLKSDGTFAVPSGTGINQLTGDVTAGPGSGSQAATLSDTAVTPGSYTNTNLTVDSKGRITAAANGSGGGVSSVTHVLGININGGGAVITTGLKGFIQCPVSGTIQSWTILSTDVSGPATSGSIVIDIWKDTYANYPPTVADTITAAAKPTVSSANKGASSTLTGWTTAVTAGDVFAFNVDSVSTFTDVTIQIVLTGTT